MGVDMRRLILGILSSGTVVLGLNQGDALGQTVSISKPFHFTDNRPFAPAEVGLVPGYRLVFGVHVTPSGYPTIAEAGQGSVFRTLAFFPMTINRNLYTRAIRFDRNLTGSWQITATRASEWVQVSTPAIANPQVVPLVENLQVSGTGLTPEVTWKVPDLTGFDVDRIRVMALDTGRSAGVLRDHIFVSQDLPTNTTRFTIPAGVLETGRTYVFRVLLEDLEGTDLENCSSTFTQPFSPAR